MRNKNDALGKAGEQRIKAMLEKCGATEVTIDSSHNGHPDCTFLFLKTKYAAECKSMIPYYNHRVSSVHLRRSEVAAMESLSADYVKCLIVELRPPNSEPLYYIVGWTDVLTEYGKTAPETKSLGLYWILQHGIRLELALAFTIVLQPLGSDVRS